MSSLLPREAKDQHQLQGKHPRSRLPLRRKTMFFQSLQILQVFLFIKRKPIKENKLYLNPLLAGVIDNNNGTYLENILLGLTRRWQTDDPNQQSQLK